MTSPPRTIERLLSGLGAHPDFRNAVLGDLAEEFASRVETDGIRGATWWYRREAARAVPHLLRSWLCGARLRDVGRVAGVIATAYTGMLIASGILVGMTVRVARAVGYHGPLLPPFSLFESTAFLIGMLAFSGALGTAAGYVTAWVDSRTPLVSAATFGGLLLLVQFGAQHTIAGPLPAVLPEWYLVGAPALGCIGTIVGGVLRVRARGSASLVP